MTNTEKKLGEECVGAESAIRLKELGFNYWTFARYYFTSEKERKDHTDNNLYFGTLGNWNNAGEDNSDDRLNFVAAPTLSQVQSWLRQKFHLHISLELQPGEPFGYIAKVYHAAYNKMIYRVGSDILKCFPVESICKGESYIYENPNDAMREGIRICLDYLYKSHDK